MTRTKTILGLVVAAGLLAACEKPTEQSCRAALSNVRALYKTNTVEAKSETTAGDVRRCVGGSSKKAVECAVNAKTITELEACNFGKK
ncbi:MAG: hypothetical protein WKG01_23885 [Kofleriaceae bacterium]